MVQDLQVIQAVFFFFIPLFNSFFPPSPQLSLPLLFRLLIDPPPFLFSFSFFFTAAVGISNTTETERNAREHVQVEEEGDVAAPFLRNPECQNVFFLFFPRITRACRLPRLRVK